VEQQHSVLGEHEQQLSQSAFYLWLAIQAELQETHRTLTEIANINEPNQNWVQRQPGQQFIAEHKEQASLVANIPPNI
jgi:chaperonin cofactor prefoldin